MSEEEETAVEEQSYETARIEISRVITADDDTVYVGWNDAHSSLLELLGMVEYARNTILASYMHDEEEGEDAEDDD